MLDFNAGLNSDQMACMLEALAAFHATAYAYAKSNNINFKEK